jgi:hypothetical protein
MCNCTENNTTGQYWLISYEYQSYGQTKRSMDRWSGTIGEWAIYNKANGIILNTYPISEDEYENLGDYL